MIENMMKSDYEYMQFFLLGFKDLGFMYLES